MERRRFLAGLLASAAVPSLPLRQTMIVPLTYKQLAEFQALWDRLVMTGK